MREWLFGRKVGEGRMYYRSSPYIVWLRLRGLRLPKKES